MDYGAHSYLFTDHWADDQVDILAEAAKLGLGYLELSVGDDVVFDPTKTRTRAEALGIRLTVGPGGVWAADCDLSSDSAAERALGLAWHKKQIDLAAAVGAEAYCGALYGHPGTIRRRKLPVAELEYTAAGLHKLASYAATLGVKVVLEPMSHFRTHLINTPQQLHQLLELADHANLYALLDTYHLVTEIRDYGAGIRLLADRLFALHACGSDRGLPGASQTLKQDLVPWTEVFTALTETDFQGLIMFETYNSSLRDGNFAFERGMFHNVCPDGAAFVEQARAFIEQGLERARA